MSREAGRHHLRHRDHTTLRSTIGGAAGVAAHAGNTGDVHARCAGAHYARARLADQEGAAQIDRNDAVEQFRRGVEKRNVGTDAGGIHQIVDAPMLLHHAAPAPRSSRDR
jgi:hypothetical protein